MELLNPTPLTMLAVPGQDRDGGDVFTVIAKGTWALAPKGKPALAPEQDPIVMADAYEGEPGASPVAYESEIAPFKPASDCVLIGSAAAQRATKEIAVEFRVGKLEKRLKVRAEKPGERISLLELERRPEKKGWGKGKWQPDGFGFRPRSAEERLAFAGTYDAAWQEERAPFPPQDFDYRYFQCAYPELTARGYLRGGEPVKIVNAGREGTIETRVPELSLAVAWRFSRLEGRAEMALDTIVCDADRGVLHLLWRHMIPCHGQVEGVRGFRLETNGSLVA